MGLPIIQLPSEDFVFSNGETIRIRGLSRAEAIQVASLIGDIAELERKAISCATQVSEAEVTTWHSSTPQADVENLVNAISRISGLDISVGKADAEDLPSAKLTE